jgi:hypothetical protein
MIYKIYIYVYIYIDGYMMNIHIFMVISIMSIMLVVNLPQFLPCFGRLVAPTVPGPPLLPRQRAGRGAPATEVGGIFFMGEV